MSTKIYNGIKFKSKSYKEIMEKLIDLKKKASEIGNKSIKKDDLVMFIAGNKLENKDSFDIFFTLQDAINSGNERATWAFLPRFTFTIYLYPTKEGDIYGYYFDQVRGYSKLLEDITDEYIYYDNSDRPDELTDEQWNERRDKWDQMVPDRFCDTGFKYSIVSGDDLDRTIIQPQITELLDSIRRDKKIDKVLDGDK